MPVTWFELTNFRNFESLELSLAPGTSVIAGENGLGKTNILEALYTGLTGSPFRARSNRELIAFGQSFFRVELEFAAADGQHKFEIAGERDGGRKYTVDGIKRRSSDALPLRPLLLVFTPDRMQLLKGPPGARRAQIDSFIESVWPARSTLRREYLAALQQRNALLAAGRTGQELDSWDRQLASVGVALIEVRQQATKLISQNFGGWAGELGLSGSCEFVYRPSFKCETEEQFHRLLVERRDRDCERGLTGAGPHRDQFKVELDGHDMRKFGSQGQQRVALLALLFAQRDGLLAEQGDREAVLVLDDVMSELDPLRRAKVMDSLAGSQAVVTTVDRTEIPAAGYSLLDIPGASISAV